MGLVLSLPLVLASAPQAALENTPLDIYYGERTPLPFQGVEKVAVTDATQISWEIINGVVFVRGQKGGQSLIYLWTAEGIQPVILNVVSAVRPVPEQRERPPVLLKSTEGLSGAYSVQGFLPAADMAQRPFLYQSVFLEMPFFETHQLSLRSHLNTQWGTGDAEIQRVGLPFANLSYQAPLGFAELGDTTLKSPLLRLYPRLTRLKGAQVTLNQESGSYQMFSGFESIPFFLYDATAQTESLWSRQLVTGGSAQWQTPLQTDTQDWGNLAFQGMAFSQQLFAEDAAPRPVFAGGLDWRFHEQGRVQVAAGHNLEGLSFLTQGFYRQDWPDLNSNLNVSGFYRHQDADARLKQDAFDLVNLRFNTFLPDQWTLGGGGGADFVSGELRGYQGSLRAGKQLFLKDLYVYGQLYGAMTSADRRRYTLTGGGLWRGVLPLTGNYSFLWYESGDRWVQHSHRLQLQSRIWQTRLFQLNLSSQSLWQEVYEQASQWSQSLRLQLNAQFSPQWGGHLFSGYQWGNDPTMAQNLQQMWQSGLGLNWQFHPLHQLTATLNYQYLDLFETQHLVSALLGYTWRFGYVTAQETVRLQGLVFEDGNQNGQRDAAEKGVAGVKVQVGDNVAHTDAQGQFVLPAVPKGKQAIFIDPTTLPAGTQVLTANPQELFLDASSKPLAIPVRRQMTLQGILFASPLLAHGLDDVEVLIDNQQTLVTQYGGRFTQVLAPGKHQIRLNPLTIPEGYRLRGPLMREIDSQDNVRVHFVFEPMITLRLTCVDAQQRALNDIKVTASATLEPQKQFQATTNAQGQVVFEGLLPGEIQLQLQGQHVTLALDDTPGVQERTVRLPGEKK